ncbi:hypothetical protein ACA910_017182 [Epithemia clementina (nom. ined.)]
MGSSQSKGHSAVESVVVPSTASTETDEKAAARRRLREMEEEEAKKLSGIALVNFKCRRKEKVYKKCVSKQFSAFVDGKEVDQEEACGELFDRYRRCYLKGIQKVIWGKDSPPPAKGSALAKFAEEDQEE